MFISATFCIVSFRTLPFIPPEKSASNFLQITPDNFPQSAFHKIPLPVFLWHLSDRINLVWSKMSQPTPLKIAEVAEVQKLLLRLKMVVVVWLWLEESGVCIGQGNRSIFAFIRWRLNCFRYCQMSVLYSLYYLMCIKRWLCRWMLFSPMCTDNY